MKKLKLLLLCLLFSLLANSQAGQINQINIVSFTVKQVLPGSIDNWISTPGALLMMAQKVPNPRMVEPRLVVQIRSGGATICGNNEATARPVDPFDVRTFNTADLTGFLNNCHELKEGAYTICVQFFNIDKIAISKEVCKDFRVEAVNIEYAPPTLITPDNGKKFAGVELQGPVMFRWSPLVPKPKEPVTYRMKVWQLMQGQNGTTAMRTNQPIATKDVDNLTQATVNGIWTGPCKPPYLCDYIWNVQALNRSGKPMGNNNGNSEPYTFSATESQIIGPENTLPADKKEFTSEEAMKGVTFRWTPVTPKPAEPVTYRMKVWQLMQGQNGSTAMKTNQPIVTKDVADITEASVSNIYTGPCRPPYLCDFIWEVQAVTRTGTTLGTSHPTEFSVKESKIIGPENTLPQDKKQFTAEEAMKGVTFRWTPITPKPAEPVTYRMKVWQLMQGQNGSTAMKTNQPIVTKDVADITEATVSNIYTGPCRPPYLCDYIWNVEAITRQAGATPKTIGTSNPTTFSIAPQYVIQLDSIKVSCTDKPGVYSFKYCITNPNAGTAKLIIFVATSSVPAGASIGTFAPPLNTPIPANSQLCITGTINAASNLSNICIGAGIQDLANSFWQAQRDTCVNVEPCQCKACDSVKINVVQKDLKFDTDGNIILNTTISVSPKPVSNIKAELVYYEYKPENDGCMLCNKDSKTFGSFSNGTHIQEWNFNPPQNISNGVPASMIITVPPTVSCCNANIRWCIRYVITFKDCTVCNKLICYEIKKEGCANENHNPKNGLK